MKLRRPVRVFSLIVLAVHACAWSALSYASVAEETHSAPAEECPCCPDDPGGMAGCLNLCGTHVLAGATLPIAIAAARDVDIRSSPTDGQSLTYAPPNPPPIR
jgi:hypothetical protein